MAKGSRRRRGLGGAITIAEKCLKRVNRRDQAKGSAVQRSHVFSHRRKGRNRRRRAGRRGQAAMQRTRRNVVIRAQCKVSRPVRQGSGQWAVVVRETALVIGNCSAGCSARQIEELKQNDEKESRIWSKERGRNPVFGDAVSLPHCSFPEGKGVPSAAASPVKVKVPTALCRTGLQGSAAIIFRQLPVRPGVDVERAGGTPGTHRPQPTRAQGQARPLNAPPVAGPEPRPAGCWLFQRPGVQRHGRAPGTESEGFALDGMQ
jgi:hypothetical protein